MASRKARREVSLYSGLTGLAQGIAEGIKTNRELESMAAERELKRRAQAIDALNAAVSLEKAGQSSQTYNPQTQAYEAVPGVPKEVLDSYRSVLRGQMGLPDLPPGVGTGMRPPGKRYQIFSEKDAREQSGTVLPPDIVPRVIGEDNPSGVRSQQRKGVVELPNGTYAHEVFDSRTGKTHYEPIPEGYESPGPATEQVLPGAKQKDITALTGAKRETQDTLRMILGDLERAEKGEKRRIRTGPTAISAYDFPGSGAIRRGFTPAENVQFFGKVRAAQSKELTEATGVQRGFQEITYLEPATISPKDTDETILAKAAQNALTHAINLQRVHGVLKQGGKRNLKQLEADMEVELPLIQNAMNRLTQKGLDTSVLQARYEEWFKSLPPKMQDKVIKQLNQE